MRSRRFEQPTVLRRRRKPPGLRIHLCVAPLCVDRSGVDRSGICRRRANRRDPSGWAGTCRTPLTPRRPRGRLSFVRYLRQLSRRRARQPDGRRNEQHHHGRPRPGPPRAASTGGFSVGGATAAGHFWATSSAKRTAGENLVRTSESRATLQPSEVTGKIVRQAEMVGRCHVRQQIQNPQFVIPKPATSPTFRSRRANPRWLNGYRAGARQRSDRNRCQLGRRPLPQKWKVGIMPSGRSSVNVDWALILGGFVADRLRD